MNDAARGRANRTRPRMSWTETPPRSFAIVVGIGIVCSGCVAAPPPQPAISQATMTPSRDDPACRDYTYRASIQGKEQNIAGHACRQADGIWKVAEGPQGQPGQVVTVYPPPPYAYPPSPYPDPWWESRWAPWWPPFGFSVGALVVVDRRHHFHDLRHFGGFHHFAAGGFHDGRGRGPWMPRFGGRHG